MIRLLIADDHPYLRQGLQLLFAAEQGIDVVGTATDGQDAVDQAKKLTPDVVLMDLRMRRVDGVEATRRIVAADPETKVLILTATHDRRLIRTALDAGAVGYILKGADAADLVQAVRDAGDGGHGDR